MDLWQQRTNKTENSAASEALRSTPPVDIPHAIWHVLHSRGIRTKDSIENFFSPSLKSLRHPMSLDEMDKAVDRLIQAFKEKETIALYGDYDLDGTPGLALLKDGLNQLGFKSVLAVQPLRLTEGYGVHKHILKSLRGKNATLLVTVDVGITDILAAAYAQEIGMDVIVTDHHLPKEELPKAVALVNPNKGTCGSGMGHLCGAGVAFYLVLALRLKMKELGLLKGEIDPKSLLDCFSIATLTDMVPLIDENRILVKHGLEKLRVTQRPGLQRLMQELGIYGRKLTSQDVGFRLAPKLNALSRLEEGLRPLDVFLATKEEAEKIVYEISAINKKRTEYQKLAQKMANQMAKAYDREPFIWVFSDEFHPGVVSLVANELSSTHKKPSFVGALKKDGQIVGSARTAVENQNLQDVLSKSSKPLVKFGGHAQAAGFELNGQSAEVFKEALRTALGKKESEGSADSSAFSKSYDAEMSLEDLTPHFMLWYEALGPFGMGFEPPVFLMKNLRVENVKKLKGSFLKYKLKDGEKAYSSLGFEALWFKDPQEFPEGQLVDLLFEPQWNYFNGKKSIQGIIKSMRVRA